uniref:NADH-ubiquinone oxidoreductase 75 kDa subunit n=1 Tax=Reclinomonas americana TaxID=48483 RepID=NDUS1_RECAM|nr:NADH dehydrogenase subunit 11 [Reclinomonas americana]O21241.1 RecName: Full=NADH-ubiquinone oxidoreductase 75 kDa subunit; AltName: Full=Complex I-75kD; Short=CI-75kD; AltName: Full=NADH dehydrogenase subunit 11 [Reclinomonas americana]AAD11868.1 NADH dehydrogenase subunit 11 [Reclinomonas americana]
MVNVFVDGLSVEVKKGATILQACAQVGIEIPRFCYHERLSIAGNCRMCLVEVEKSPKPVASCAMPVMDNMKIFTNTPLVKKAREGVLEFLLVNHPLDCPICDQGGECDLQDLTMVYGSDRGRFHEYKRGVEDKNIGPLVKTVMTRCIHCTRCVRFATEVAGVPDLGTVGRGRDTEISTYIQKVFNSELSGNVIDLCPVGALTSKPYAFTARSWELQSTESIDVSDAIGSNIRIDVRGSEIMRILPRLNEDVNEEWISDKARFCYDGLKRQRLNNPIIKENGQYKTVTWEKAFNFILKNLQEIQNSNRIVGVVGNLMDVESILLFKELLNKLGSSKIYLESSTPILQLNDDEKEDQILNNADFRNNYISNTPLAKIEESDLCLLIGTNIRLEAPLLNTRIRKRYLQGNYSVYSVGPTNNLTYNTENLGNDISTLLEISEGRHPFCKKLMKSKKPLIIIGTHVLQRTDGTSIIELVKTLFKYTQIKTSNWNGFNILHTSASSVGALDLGIGSTKRYSEKISNSKIEKHFIYLLGADEIRIENSKEHFIVYQGHHGDYGANIADVILPGSAYTEKTATYVNVEGRVQNTKSAFYAPGNAREDWKIIRALSEVLNKKLPYDSFEDIHTRFMSIAPHLLKVNAIEKNKIVIENSLPFKGLIKNIGFKPLFNNFYLTNAICRSSQTMAKCSSIYKLN